jgi:hypothetical protein
MRIKQVFFAATAAFALGLGFTVSIATAQSNGWCEYCESKCVQRYNSCMRIRNDEAFCEPILFRCLTDCGCGV